jgi:hypothetical protein
MEDQNKINLIKDQIKSAEKTILMARKELAKLGGGDPLSEIASPPDSAEGARQIIEGFFNGQNMADEESHEYPVPANYASKSKLVEGDRLKLVITADGSFIYKQIGPVERKRVIGTLMQQENGDYFVLVDGKSYRVLLASVTYFKVKIGDEVSLLVPSDRDSAWGTIENIFSAGLEKSADKFSKVQGKEENPAEDIEDEWTPDFDEIKKEAPDEEEIKASEENFDKDEFENPRQKF